jgi:5-enolpyruvylshikimate-3-phosphate synthase
MVRNILTGNNHMKQQSVSDIVEVLKVNGAKIEYRRGEGKPLMHRAGKNQPAGDCDNVFAIYLAYRCLSSPHPDH